MNWTSVRTELSEDDAKGTIDSLNALADTLRSRKCKSALWCRMGHGDIDGYMYTLMSPRNPDTYSPTTYYEVLIPGIKDKDKTVLEDLGYIVCEMFNMSKNTRRSNYTKVLIPKKK